jgi:hypothetical protein
MLKNEEVFGGLFHPNSDEILVTFGKKHLNIWKRRDDQLHVQKSFKSVGQLRDSLLFRFTLKLITITSVIIRHFAPALP